MDLLKPFSFELPIRIEYGIGISAKLPEELRKLMAKNILVVTDDGIIKAGLLNKIIPFLDQAGLQWNIFHEVEPNPRDYNVHNGAQMAEQLGVNTLIAVGGGSPIDCAKAIGIILTHGGQIRDYEEYDKITKNILPLIAIPTTAGSGSEVTFTSVITDSKESLKFGIKNPNIAAKVALVDPEMTGTMPPGLTAATGFDALTHAIEAYTAKAAEPLADACALHAVELIIRNLKTCVFEGNDIEPRAGMLLGSILAALAFSHSDVAAVHAAAEALGGKYDAPHGSCNAICLPEVMEYNLSYCKERYARIASAMGLTYQNIDEGAQKAVTLVRKLAKEVQLPTLKSLGVREEHFKELAQIAAKNICSADNPRPMDSNDYLEIYRRLFAAD